MALQYHLTTSTQDDLLRQVRFEEVGAQEQTGARFTHLPAEWHPQGAIMLTWPHPDTDWAPMLADVTRCYLHMALEIALRERLIIVTPQPDELRNLLFEKLPRKALSRISIHQMPTNDTWARDHGPLTLLTAEGTLLLDFCFNGWGEKFDAQWDNQISNRLWEDGTLGGGYEDHLDFVLEGGSIESDGRGTLLTTSRCLLAPHRNQPLSQADIEKRLLSYFRAQRILWLDYGLLAGDDTDGHIDTLARFCPNDTIAYVQCDDPADEHYEELRSMEDQLRAFRTLEDRPYRLLPLPMVPPTYDEEGRRLPATYANFLILDGAVLMPSYGHLATDERALLQLRLAFPRHEIVPIDARPLIRQGGSVHCCAMQFPRELTITHTPLCSLNTPSI